MNNVFAYNTGDSVIRVQVSDNAVKRKLLLLQKQYHDLKILSRKGDEFFVCEIPIAYLHFIKPLSYKERKKKGKYDLGQRRDQR